VKFEMAFWIVLARIYQRPTFVSFWKMIGFVFRSIAHPTSKQEIVPIKGKVGTASHSALWAEMFDMPVVGMSNLALAVCTLPVKHLHEGILYFPVPKFRLRSQAFRLSICG
jgi:hypothetical protein